MTPDHKAHRIAQALDVKAALIAAEEFANAFEAYNTAKSTFISERTTSTGEGAAQAERAMWSAFAAYRASVDNNGRPR